MIILKNRIRFVVLVTAIALTTVVISSCKKDNNDPDENSNFDQKAMLKNYADNLIVPSYQNTANSILDLKAAIVAFEQNYSASNLETVQEKWLDLYSNWIWASGYNFGPAGEQGITKRLAEEVSTFPVDTTAVNTRISSLDTSFSDFKRDARGLLAIEFMIFNTQKTNAEIATTFQNNANRIQYLKALINKVESQVGDVLSQWENGYRNSFIENTGTSVGSSVSMMYNEFVRGYEAIKNFKLGIPLGVKAGQTGTEPDKVEALFSGQSLPFLQENITAVENNWFGKSKNGADAIGWKEYIESVTGGADLIGGTETQQNNIATALATINQNTTLFEQINTNKTALDNLYTELQKQTRFYKSDMSSLLGIAITFTDADGD